jgi:hypothetical protein
MAFRQLTKSYRAIVVSAVMLFSSSHVAYGATGKEDWRAKTIDDINAAHDLIGKHSPAAVDQANAPMREWYTTGRAQALERAQAVDSEAGWRWVVSAYVNGFQDPHLAFRPSNPTPLANYPHFIVEEKGTKAVVAWVSGAAVDGPEIGAVLTSCDGLQLDELRARQVFSYALNPKIAADQRLATRNIFLDRSVPFAPRVKACSFDGDVEKAVVWRTAPPDGDAFWAAWTLAGLGPPAVAGVSEPMAGVTWIGLPSFAPIGPSSRAIDAAVSALNQRGSAIRQGRAIVVDVRGNNGGTSLQGEKLANAIWGADYVKANRLVESSEAVDWRVSASNADYLRTGSLMLRLRFPGQSYGKHLANKVVPGIQASLPNGGDLFRDGTATPQIGGGAANTRRRGEKPFPARVIILTNGSCASACLDFADIALNMPGTVLLGRATGADGLLMEVRSMDLPSARGSLSIPIKVARGRWRGNLEAYPADIEYEGKWNDLDVRNWIKELLAEGKI